MHQELRTVWRLARVSTALAVLTLAGWAAEPPGKPAGGAPAAPKTPAAPRAPDAPKISDAPKSPEPAETTPTEALPLVEPAPAPGTAPDGTAQPLPDWGKEQQGLQLRLELAAPPASKGAFTVRVGLKSVAPQPVAVVPPEQATLWLFVAQAKKSYYTAKQTPFTPAVGWRDPLPTDTVVATEPLALATAELFPYRTGLVVINGYPAPKAGDKTPVKAAGAVRDLLAPGKALARAMLYLPRLADGALLLVSNTAEFDVGPPALAELPAAERQAYLDALDKQFNTSAGSAKGACELAKQLGPQALPFLIPAAKDAKRPWFTRMWLASALIEVGTPDAVPTLLELLNTGPDGVVDVICFHGPRLKQEKLDVAVLAKALATPRMATKVWAIRGLVVFTGSVPEPLVRQALAAPEPRVRQDTIQAIASRPTPGHVRLLSELLGSDDEATRGLAANGLAATKQATRQVLASLLLALDRPGDQARANVCHALGLLTGHELAYDPEADAAAKEKVLRQWRDWWRQHGKDYP